MPIWKLAGWAPFLYAGAMLNVLRSTVVAAALCVAAAAAAGDRPAATLAIAPGAAVAIDGDTFRWARERVRLKGVDTPEEGEPGHAAARAALQAWLDRGGILRPVARDRYGRLVGVLTVDGEDVGRALARAGYGKAERRR